VGLMGSSTAGRPMRKSSHFLSGSHLVLSAGTLLWFPAWNRKSLAGALGKAADGQRELQTATPVSLSSASSSGIADAGTGS